MIDTDRRDHLDFGAKAGDYVAAVMNTLNWSNVDKLFEPASRA